MLFQSKYHHMWCIMATFFLLFFCFQTSFVDIPGPSSKRLNRHLSINSRQDMVSNPVWWISISKFQFDRELEGHGFVSCMTVMCNPRKNKQTKLIYVLCTCITVHIVTLVCTCSQSEWFHHAALPQSTYFTTFYILWIHFMNVPTFRQPHDTFIKEWINESKFKSNNICGFV